MFESRYFRWRWVVLMILSLGSAATVGAAEPPSPGLPLVQAAEPFANPFESMPEIADQLEADVPTVGQEAVRPACSRCGNTGACPRGCGGILGKMMHPKRELTRAHGHDSVPFGSSYHTIMQTQISRGEAARMMLYKYDFLPGQPDLSYRGRMQMQKLATLANRNDYPLVIEVDRDHPHLNQERLAAVVAELAMLPIVIPAERVVLGTPLAPGLAGVDAEIIYQNRLQLTAGGTSSGPSAGTTGAGTAR